MGAFDAQREEDNRGTATGTACTQPEAARVLLRILVKAYEK
jgi:hypothetical protein